MAVVIINSDGRTYTVSNEDNKADYKGNSCS